MIPDVTMEYRWAGRCLSLNSVPSEKKLKQTCIQPLPKRRSG